MKKKELFFIIGMLLLAGILWAGIQLFAGGKSSRITITVNGKTYGTYSLSEDQIIQINDTNVCEIKEGQVRMIEASCPDQLCIHQLPINQNSHSIIVCLPNEVVISGEQGGTVKYSDPEAPDAVAQ